MHGFISWIQTVLIPVLGPTGLFVVAFLDSSFLSIPEINDILVVSFSAADPGRAWLAVLMATLGSLAGCLVLREIGWRGGEHFLVKRFGAERVARTRAAFERWNVLTLALPALLPPPTPFKIFVLSAGVFGLPRRRFLITVALARGLRYSVWAALGAIWGPEAMAWLRAADHFVSDNPLVVLWVFAVGLLFTCLWLLWRRRRAAGTPVA
jgi:membrane protein YqaA with SNARE-associated domain